MAGGGQKGAEKICQLIKDIKRMPFKGIGKQEPLKYDLTGLWSRRSEREHRLVYQVINQETFVSIIMTNDYTASYSAFI